jgi:hypothetical protein
MTGFCRHQTPSALHLDTVSVQPLQQTKMHYSTLLLPLYLLGIAASSPLDARTPDTSVSSGLDPETLGKPIVSTQSTH